MTNTEESIFARVTALPIEQRQEYLDVACNHDLELRKRIEILLAAHEDKEGVLDIADTQDVSSDEMDLAAGQDFGQYRLLQKIGEGGFGIVFMAEQRKPIQRKVAIKVIKPGMDSKAVIARFEGERQALAMMEHPNIARVFDGGTSDIVQRPYFVMELVSGVPITEFCDTNSLTTRERLELFIHVCNAVHHAHQKGIIHRDIKPNNVMVTLHDGKPVVKVIDFGVAKALHQRLTEKTLFTQYGMMVGTPQYMSPEQAEMTGLDVDTRSDVYSLAVLLYELMTGTTPLSSNQLRTAGFKQMQRMICEDEAVIPSLRLSSLGEKLTVLAKHRSVAPARLTSEIQGDLDWIVMKGLEKERKRRYDSAKELAADVQRSLNNHPVLAGPPSPFYRARKFVVRNRIGLALAATSLGILATVAFAVVNNQMHVIAASKKDERRLNNAIDEAHEAMIVALESSSANELWTSADLAAARIRQLTNDSRASHASLIRAGQFLEGFEQARQDRLFTYSMEELLINHSTDRNVKSMELMEKEFRRILRRRGFDLEQLEPSQLGRQLKTDRTPLKITDALELWLSVRIKLSKAGGVGISTNEIEEWIDAMCVGDPNPMRSAIRKTIFGSVLPDQNFLVQAVDQADLSTACARKLSWLAEAYQRVGQPERADQIRDFALAQHPGDLLLNYEHATYLMSQGEYGEAIRYLMRCTAIRPEIPGVWKELSEAFGRNEEPANAKKAIHRAIDLDPNDAVSHSQLARWLLEDGDAQAANSSAETALLLDDELADAWCTIGKANMKLNNPWRALLAFEKFKMVADDNLDSVSEAIQECRVRIANE